MKIEDLKNKIESHNIEDESFIFINHNSDFLIHQYIVEIAKQKGLAIKYVNSINTNMFSIVDVECLNVFTTDEFNSNINDLKNYIIITKKSSNDCAVEFKELEQWQIKDYIYSICQEVPGDALDNFIKTYKDLYRLDYEVSKLSIFSSSERNHLVNEFIANGIFNGINSVDIFEFVKYIQNNDLESIKNSYKHVNFDPMAFVGLLYRQFTNMMTVYLSKNPNEQNTGLKSNQIWAINNVCKKYTKQQIFDAYKLLLEIDYKLKTGLLPVDLIFDYVLTKLMYILRKV